MEVRREETNCKAGILSEDTYDFITDFTLGEFAGPGEEYCYANIDNLYNIVYIEKNRVPGRRAGVFEYQSVPKLYTLSPIQGAGGENGFQPDALIVSDILQAQRPPLQLTGRGCVICFIDTGIDYTMDVFRTADGRSRILAIWDQTIQTGIPPEGFAYGTEYNRDEIDRALRSANPYEIVPSRDTNGHGTKIASVAAGSSISGARAFVGAAPEADIVVVKLKESKQYLRQLFLVAEGASAYQENDIMLGVQYADRFARVLNRPVILCIGLSSNMGDHAGSSALARYLNQIAVRRSRGVVVCGGDEGNMAHHYRGRMEPGADGKQSVEVRVGENCSGFLLECWSSLPDTHLLGVRSPGGEFIPPLRVGTGQTVRYELIYEDSVVTLGATLVEPASGEQLMQVWIETPTPGIWSFEVSTQGEVYNGIFDMWLPITEFLNAPVYFLNPDPFITLTDPSMASEVITVSSYNAGNASFSINSGRGYSRTGIVRPDIAAPGGNVSTIDGLQNGSALAAAITAGAMAQLLQWAVVERKNLYAESRELKSYLIRGASREEDLGYPNRTWGYGRLSVTGVFERMRT